MLCEDCGRNRAVVHITQIGPDGKIEKNLCERCAAKYGEIHMENQKHRNVSMNDFLKGVFSAGAQGEKPQQEKVTELVCPNCGMSYRDFQQTGKIGCSVCYATFRRQLEPLLRRIHGSSTHSGKIPHRTGGTLTMKHTIESLRSSLKECVAQEEYEKAAELRDKIRLLEHELMVTEGGESDGRQGTPAQQQPLVARRFGQGQRCRALEPRPPRAQFQGNPVPEPRGLQPARRGSPAGREAPAGHRGGSRAGL